MTIGEIWWSRLVNSVRFIDNVINTLAEEKSVIMNFQGNVPWLDDMLYFLEQKLVFMTETRSFETHDASEIRTTPGKYLFERFCSEEERKKYWPSRDKCYERFLATNNNTPLNRRIICITNINSSNITSWLKTITEYLENRNSEERGIFILVVQKVNTYESKLMGNILYSDYVTDYDCLMLCLTILSSEKGSSLQKQYVSEIADNIAEGDVETAGILATAGIKLAKSPLETANEILQENNIHIPNLQYQVTTAVWKAQIKLVFPCIEDFRSEIIQKYQVKLQKSLHNNKVTEIEIGQLFFICAKGKFISKSEFDLLSRMRDARNCLAHRNTLTYDDLIKLKIL